MRHARASQGGSILIRIIAACLLRLTAVFLFLLLPSHSHAQGIAFDAASLDFHRQPEPNVSEQNRQRELHPSHSVSMKWIRKTKKVIA
jgi:hypothetical protein